MPNQDFLSTYVPLANDIATRTNIDPSVVLGIIDTETGGGQHVSGNNIFGISPGGKVAQYPDVSQAAQAFVDLMQTKHYQGVPGSGGPDQQAAALVQGGYNSANPKYAGTVAASARATRAALGVDDGQPGGSGAGTQTAAASPMPDYSDPPAKPAQAQPPATSKVSPGPAGVPSDADFLKATGADPAKPGAESDADFLKRTGAAPAGGTPPPAGTDTGGVGRNIAAGVLDTAGNVGNLLSNPFYNLVAHPLAVAGGTAYDAAAKLFGFPQMTDAQRADLYGQSSGPQIGTRAISALGQAIGGDQMDPAKVTADTTAERLTRAGVGGAGTMAVLGPGGALAPVMGAAGAVAGDVAGDAAPNWLRPAAQLAGNVVGGAATVPLALGARAAVNALESGVTRFAEGPAQTPQIAAPEEGVSLPTQQEAAPGVPGSVGAAASREGTPPGQIELSPAQMKANRRQAEMGEVNAPPQANDTTIYVPGSNPTLAQRAGNPATSQQETVLMQRNPEAFTGEGGVLTQQNAARVKALEDVTPSDTQVQGWRDDRAALAKKDSEAVLANSKPADLQPAVDYIDGILNDPRIRENPDVVSTMSKLRDGLFNADGSLKTDPQAVWGMHDRVINMMAKAKDPLNATGAEKFSFTQLDGYKQVLDGVMNAATGNHFQTFLDHYAELSKQINAGELLNKFRQLGATNAKGDLMANRFHKFVSDLAYSRGKPGLDPSMDIPDETMRSLIGIDSDLKRAGQIDLGKARGSPTNLFGAIAADLGIGAAHLGMAAMTHGNPTGNLLLQGAMRQGQNLLSRTRLRSLTNKHLAPPPGGYTQPPNYLNPQP